MAEYAGIGTLFQMSAVTPVSYALVAQVGDTNGPTLSAGTYDTTTHDNVLAGYKDFITGLKDGGEITLKLYFDVALHGDASGKMLYYFNNQTSAGYLGQLVLTQYTSPYPKWTFTFAITKMGAFAYPVDGVQSVEITLKVKGKPTLA
jgi:hypothetical protein